MRALLATLQLLVADAPQPDPPCEGHVSEQVILLHVWQDVDRPGTPPATAGAVRGDVAHAARWQVPLLIVEVVDGKAHLLEVVLTLHACCGFAHFLNGGQKQSDEDGDNRNHNQQLNQRETTPTD